MYIEPINSYLSNVSKIHEYYLNRSIRRLSTGTWVNSAADNAQMLSRKMREKSQLDSLEQYKNNINDRITLGESADSGLQEISSVIARMRELAVSASNSTVSQSDRAELNSELSLLKTEVNNILESTDFNTKKLLNGQLAGSVSTNQNNLLDPHVKGAVKNGEYHAEIYFNSAKETTNHILSTNIFNVKSGLASISDDDYQGAEATVVISANFSASGSISFDFDGDTYTISLDSQADTNDIVSAMNSDSWLSDYLLATYSSSGSVTLEARDYGTDKNDWEAVRVYSGVSTATQTFIGGTDSINGITLAGNPESLLSSSDSSSKYNAYLIYTSATTESASNTSLLARYEQTSSTGSAMLIYSGAVTAPEGGGYLAIELDESGTINTATGSLDVRYSFDGSAWNTYSIDSTYFQDGGIELTDGSSSVFIGTTALTTADFTSGDMHLFSLVDSDYNPADNHVELQIQAPIDDGTGNSVQNSTIYSRNLTDIESSTTTFDVMQLDTTNGAWVTGSIDFEFSAIVTSAQSSDLVYFDIDESGGTANLMTQLSSIDTFFDYDGNFLLSESGNSLYLKNRAGDEVSVDIYPSDTVEDVRQLLSSAVMTLFNVDMNEDAKNNLVSFVTNAKSGTMESTEGQFVIRSPLPGSEGEIFAYAENDYIDSAFSFSDLQDASGESFYVDMNDTTYHISGGELNSAINNLSIGVDETLLIRGEWSGREKNLIFSAKETVDADITVHDTSLEYLRSIYGGSENFAIPDFSIESLRLDEIDLSTVNLSQRTIDLLEDAERDINKFTGALGGEIERAYTRLNSTDNEIYHKESLGNRLFSTDVAKEYTEMTKRLMLQSTVSSMFDITESFMEQLYKIIS